MLAGVNGTDPFRLMDVFLDQLKTMGFAGVQNFPTVGIIDGTFRANLEETGMSYGLEVDMIAAAHAKDMLTTPMCSARTRPTAMAKAGADIVVCHLGLTTGGSIGAETALKLEDCAAKVDAWAEAALKVRARHYRAGARRAGVESGRCLLHHKQYEELPRLLWCVINGAPAHRGGAHRADTEVQGDWTSSEGEERNWWAGPGGGPARLE